MDMKGTHSSKNIWWNLVVFNTIQNIQGSKDKGILNVFGGAYDHTNNPMWIHSYKKKTGKQFLDFIKRVDQKYDFSVKQIFLILDNVSIHKSNNKVKKPWPGITQEYS